MIQLDLIATLACTGLALWIGHGLRSAVPLLGRFNIPAPVIGGLTVAAILFIFNHLQWEVVKFDNTLQKPLMGAFFASIGFRMSLALLRAGGLSMLYFLLICTLGAILQNLLGAMSAILLGQPPLFGVLCGSVTLAGGPATGLAFAPQFEAAGIPGAEAVAIAAAILGIILGGIVGTPMATLLIERYGCLKENDLAPETVSKVTSSNLRELNQEKTLARSTASFRGFKNITVVLLAMWIGSLLSNWLTAHVLTLPIYMGAMVIAAIIRNFDDGTNLLGLSSETLDEIGNISLSFFLTMSLMTLELWRLMAVAVPMVAILLVQTIFMICFCLWPTFYSMGRNYEGAVIAGGFLGFMLGTTANALANMDALVHRHGPAPLAYLVVPVVGAFFIDFTNAITIQVFVNLLR